MELAFPTGSGRIARPGPRVARCARETPCPRARAADRVLLSLDAGELDYLRPLFGRLRDDRAELSRRASRHRAPQLFDSALDPGIGEGAIELLVQQIDDVGRGAL